MRLDQALVHFQLAPSRTKAQELIERGSVEIRLGQEWKKIETSSFRVPESCVASDLRLIDAGLLQYVSRGGLKLKSALQHLQLDVRAWSCLDVGQSTGGFSDCLLQEGAARVVGLDVGHDQLAPSLRADPRISVFEGVHIQDLEGHEDLRKERPAGGFDLAVMDLSFISFEKGLGPLAGWCRRALCLVKPQFEVGAAHLNKKGIVKDPLLFVELETEAREWSSRQGWLVLDYFPSKVEGRDGNQEFFLYLQWKGDLT